MTYGINLADATKDPMIGLMIAPVVQGRKMETVGKNIDDVKLVFECSDERSKAIIDMIRRKYPIHMVRCYKGKKRI